MNNTYQPNRTGHKLYQQIHILSTQVMLDITCTCTSTCMKLLKSHTRNLSILLCKGWQPAQTGQNLLQDIFIRRPQANSTYQPNQTGPKLYQKIDIQITQVMLSITCTCTSTCMKLLELPTSNLSILLCSGGNRPKQARTYSRKCTSACHK